MKAQYRVLISLLAFLAIALCGCKTARLNPNVSGTFKNPEGKRVMFTPEGEVYGHSSSASGNKYGFIGMLSPEKDQPHKVHVVTPSTGVGQWKGATVIFSEDFNRFKLYRYEPGPDLKESPVSTYERVEE